MKNPYAGKLDTLLKSDFIDVVADYLTKHLSSVGENWWQQKVIDKLSGNQIEQISINNISKLDRLDLAALCKVFDLNWSVLRPRDKKLNKKVRSYVNEIAEFRNDFAHANLSQIPISDTKRCAETTQLFIGIIDRDNELNEKLLKIIQDIDDSRNSSSSKDGKCEGCEKIKGLGESPEVISENSIVVRGSGKTLNELYGEVWFEEHAKFIKDKERKEYKELISHIKYYLESCQTQDPFQKPFFVFKNRYAQWVKSDWKEYALCFQSDKASLRDDIFPAIHFYPDMKYIFSVYGLGHRRKDGYGKLFENENFETIRNYLKSKIQTDGAKTAIQNFKYADTVYRSSYIYNGLDGKIIKALADDIVYINNKIENYLNTLIRYYK